MPRINSKVQGITKGKTAKVTKYRKLEGAFKLNEDYFKAIIENSMDGIFVVDRKGVIRYGSPSFERLRVYTS